MIPKSVEALANYAADLEAQMEPPPEGAASSMTPEQRSEWIPDLNPTQLDIYSNFKSRYILAHGERGSGKSIAMLHKLVKHCFEEFNALALIVVGIKRTAIEGGAWHKLQYDVLPQWEQGIGLKYTESKSVASTKDDYIYVENKWGGYSRILLVSMPVDSFVRDRVRGLEPSIVFVDELTTLESDVYFSAVVQQIGRRPHIKGAQQYLAATNPDGQLHWVYKRFFISPRDKETGKWDKKYAVYHVPIKENLHHLPDGYYDNVLEATRDDPVEYKRLVLGEWVDRPSGSAIFKGYFEDSTHMRGRLEDNTRILPIAGHDVILGYDLGSANSAIVFLQNIPTKDRDLWIAFDEMNYCDAYIPYIQLVPAIMRRIKFWNDTCNTVFKTWHISDTTAFNMFRATDGTYDALEVERLSDAARPDFPNVEAIKMIPAPKYNGSVQARVKTVIKYLQQDRLIISASCQGLRNMFMHLESEKMKDGKYMPDLPFQPRRSKHLHVFDAMSYALFFYEVGQSPMLFKSPTQTELMPIGVGTRKI